MLYTNVLADVIIDRLLITMKDMTSISARGIHFALLVQSSPHFLSSGIAQIVEDQMCPLNVMNIQYAFTG